MYSVHVHVYLRSWPTPANNQYLQVHVYVHACIVNICAYKMYVHVHVNLHTVYIVHVHVHTCICTLYITSGKHWNDYMYREPAFTWADLGIERISVTTSIYYIWLYNNSHIRTSVFVHLYMFTCIRGAYCLEYCIMELGYSSIVASWSVYCMGGCVIRNVC